MTGTLSKLSFDSKQNRRLISKAHFHFSVNPVPYDRRLAKKKKFQNVKTSPIKLNDQSIINTGIEKDMYIQLCRGIDLRPPQKTKDLICKYEHRNIPFYKYGPRKIEIVNYDPYIAVMHEFFTETEIKEYIEIAAPKLKRSAITGKGYGINNSSFSDIRVSEQTWITEDMSPSAQRVTDRIDGFLGLKALSTRDAELYQIANYGIAGQYDVHYDQVMMEPGISRREWFNVVSGDRMATVN